MIQKNKFLEYLMVISVLGVLVAMLLPAIQAARSAARKDAARRLIESNEELIESFPDTFNTKLDLLEQKRKSFSDKQAILTQNRLSITALLTQMGMADVISGCLGVSYVRFAH